MAFDGDDLDAAPAVRQRGKRSALLIGLLLTLLGAAILIGPLLYVMYTDPAGEESGALIIGLPLFLFISALFLAFGLTVLFSQVVDYGAVGAGRVRILGLEMPMEFQGAAMLLFLLLLGMGASIRMFDLMSLNENWSKWTRLRAKVVQHETTIAEHDGLLANLTRDHVSELARKRAAHDATVADLRAQVADLQGRLEASQAGAQTLREVLIAQTNTSVHRLMIRFKCWRLGEPRLVTWSGHGSSRTGNLLSQSAPGPGENATELPSQTLNPFTLTAGSEMTYTIMSMDELEQEKTPVISAAFHFEEENLVATIWPNKPYEMSLHDLCRRQSDPRRAARASDGQAPAVRARSWQEKLESEGDGL